MCRLGAVNHHLKAGGRFLLLFWSVEAQASLRSSVE